MNLQEKLIADAVAKGLWVDILTTDPVTGKQHVFRIHTGNADQKAKRVAQAKARGVYVGEG